MTNDLQTFEDTTADYTRDARRLEAAAIHAWRSHQLRRLGLSAGLADLFADTVDWHAVADLVDRGCPPLLALEIVR
jgi:sirohydrochlorin ferrochelatase